MKNIRAIETHYAGHRFRSRLEARWAYAFDLLNIRWQYEPEGVIVSHRLTCKQSDDAGFIDPDTFGYLPDFWLPELEIWTEVKGSLSSEGDLLKILDAIASLHSPGMCDGSPGQRTLLLGPIVNPFRAPWLLRMSKGALFAESWMTPESDEWLVAQDWSPGEFSWKGIRDNSTTSWQEAADLLLSGAPLAKTSLRSVMTAAAQARFEHGETPARP